MPTPSPTPPTLPDGWTVVNEGVCSTCGDVIWWCLTPKGNRAPMNPDGKSHFSTCPQAGDHRRRR